MHTHYVKEQLNLGKLAFFFFKVCFVGFFFNFFRFCWFFPPIFLLLPNICSIVDSQWAPSLNTMS